MMTWDLWHEMPEEKKVEFLRSRNLVMYMGRFIDAAYWARFKDQIREEIMREICAQ